VQEFNRITNHLLLRKDYYGECKFMGSSRRYGRITITEARTQPDDAAHVETWGLPGVCRSSISDIGIGEEVLLESHITAPSETWGIPTEIVNFSD
jgi:hypothetical protein